VFELGTDGPRAILVGIDGSDTSVRAAAYAAGLARRQHSRLEVLYVHSIGGVSMSAGVGAEIAAAEAEIARQLRADLVAYGRSVDLDATFHERTGNPFRELVTLADELRVDAVVVGASTHAGHRLVGSLALHLVRVARWPVTVVP
jgi:nucleotide-binding universal stress UspA family protein